jgi:hypothetical protein
LNAPRSTSTTTYLPCLRALRHPRDRHRRGVAPRLALLGACLNPRSSAQLCAN